MRLLLLFLFHAAVLFSTSVTECPPLGLYGKSEVSSTPDNKNNFYLSHPAVNGSFQWQMKMVFSSNVDSFVVVNPCDTYLKIEDNKIFEISGHHPAFQEFTVETEWSSNATSVEISLCDRFNYSILDLNNSKPPAKLGGKRYQKCTKEEDVGKMWWDLKCSEICRCNGVKQYTCEPRCKPYEEMEYMKTRDQWKQWCKQIYNPIWENDGNYFCISKFCKKIDHPVFH